MTWSEFVTRFRDKFSPAVEIQQLGNDFLDMRQTTESVAEITAKFRGVSYWFLSTRGMRI